MMSSRCDYIMGKGMASRFRSVLPFLRTAGPVRLMASERAEAILGLLVSMQSTLFLVSRISGEDHNRETYG